MWKEEAARIFIGVSGLAAGALFVMTLRGAAQVSADLLQRAQARAEAVAVAVEGASRADVTTLAVRTPAEPPHGR